MLALKFALCLFSISLQGTLALNFRKPSVESSGNSSERPNFVVILADDLHNEPGILEHFKNLRRMKDEGLEFVNHVSQSPQCGPSRASMLVGRLPHNSGYMSNDGEESLKLFGKVQNDNIGRWLTDAGYYTAFLGKYVNGMDYAINLPLGWNYWGSFTSVEHEGMALGGAYTYYNSSQWLLEYDEKGETLKQDGLPFKIWEGVHQADLLGAQTVEHAKKGVEMGKPFLVFTNPLMVHHGTCQGPFEDENDYAYDDPYFELHTMRGAHISVSPCAKKERDLAFLQERFGGWMLHHHTSSWNKTAVGMASSAAYCCKPKMIERLQIGAQNRTGSLLDLDDMVGVILDGLARLNVLDNTYVIFTSDNGFHMGEHKYLFGKELPYDHDVSVPMVIRTPSGMPRGDVRYLPTSHVDIASTIIDLAGARDDVPSLSLLDGKSFSDALRSDVTPEDWGRRFSFSEMFEPDGRTWRQIRYIGDTGKPAFSLHLWCSGEVEVYLMEQDDADQMLNVVDPKAGDEANKLGKAVLNRWLPVIHGMGTCTGHTCNSAKDVSEDIGDKQLSELMTCAPSLP